MKLNSEEQAMLAGDLGPVRKLAMEHQVKVGEFFGAQECKTNRGQSRFYFGD
jgi:predicted aconitase